MYTLSVISTSKSPLAITEIRAVVEVNGTATFHEVVDAGLGALHETRARLYGWGVRDDEGFRLGPNDTVTDAIVTVFAQRD